MYRCGIYAGNPLYNRVNTKGYMAIYITLNTAPQTHGGLTTLSLER